MARSRSRNCSQIAYNSCGNRHCPTCQATASARWLEARAAELLPVPYFHLVFTLPDALNSIALGNPRVVYDLLLRCAAETVLDLALCRELLGGSRAAEPEAAEAVKVPEGPESITPTRVCPACGAGRMVVIAEFPRAASAERMVVGVEECAAVDSS